MNIENNKPRTRELPTVSTIEVDVCEPLLAWKFIIIIIIISARIMYKTIIVSPNSFTIHDKI